MSNSILISIKKMLGIEEQYTHFDMDIIMGINSTLMVVRQLGVGNSITITDDSTEWSDLLGARTDLEDVKTFIYLKVKLLFDPPTNPSVITSIENQIREIEWRLSIKEDST